MRATAATLALFVLAGCGWRFHIDPALFLSALEDFPLIVSSTLRDNGELYVVLQPAGRDHELRFYRHDRRGWSGPVVVTSGNGGLVDGQLACGLDERGHLHVFAGGLTPTHLELDRDGGVRGEMSIRLDPLTTLRMAADPCGDLAVVFEEEGRTRVVERPGGGAWTERTALTLPVAWTRQSQRGDHRIEGGCYRGPAGTRDFRDDAAHVSLHLDRFGRPHVLVARSTRLEAHVREDGTWRADSVELPVTPPVDPEE